MNNRNLTHSNPEDFLKKFVETYVLESLRIGSMQVSLDEFDKTVRGNVSEALHIPLELVLALHHPFHWVLFNQVGFESMFSLQQPIYRGEQMKVLKEREYSPEEIDACKSFIMGNYGDYLKARLSSFGTD